MEETKKDQVDPESFAGYFERTDANRKNQKKVIKERVDSSKTDLLDDMLLEIQGGEVQLRHVVDGAENNIIQELR